MIIIQHSSKTMSLSGKTAWSEPQFDKQAKQLNKQIADLNTKQVSKLMKVSEKLAKEVIAKAKNFGSSRESPAIYAFKGDIYSGMQADTLSKQDLEYAQEHMVILSGAYGILRPMDGVKPYRYEMGYKTPDRSQTMYKFWGDKIAKQLPSEGTIINTSSAEYTKTILPFLDKSRVITPKFMTVNEETGKPKFVVVHAKIARGAYARWLIDIKATDSTDLSMFNRMGYKYDPSLSTDKQPVYVCHEFQGLGLSVRLS